MYPKTLYRRRVLWEKSEIFETFFKTSLNCRIQFGTLKNVDFEMVLYVRLSCFIRSIVLFYTFDRLVLYALRSYVRGFRIILCTFLKTSRHGIQLINYQAVYYLTCWCKFWMHWQYTIKVQLKTALIRELIIDSLK